jgi:NAD+ synthase
VQGIIQHISNWLKHYAETSHTNGFVVGISGGIDSALTSTLCALTGKKVLVLNMPIRQFKQEFDRSAEHIRWLQQKFPNVSTETVDLTGVLEAYEKALPKDTQDFLSMANTRSRIRMSTLYAFACNQKLLVAGTGNKVEDFGVGFFTKYGDGGVDVSPIADLYKSEVYALARALGVVDSILNAAPTDGLFADGRSDEDQIGATYNELEWAMEYIRNNSNKTLSEREAAVMKIYTQRHQANKHKMEAIPVCIIPQKLKENVW